MTLLVIYLILAIGVSFICSILEAVLLSVSDSYVAMLEADGHKHGKLLREMKDDIDRPLATILSLNTIAHTVGAAGVGAQAQVVFGSAYLSITSAVLTLMILIFSEIIPKTLGARYWRQLTLPSARLLQVLIIVLLPLVWFCQKITGLLGSSGHSISFTREEFAAMAERGAEQGLFEEKEARAVKNMVYFQSLYAKDVMTPRPVVVSLDQNSTVSEAIDVIGGLHFSRFPVYCDHKEDIKGYVLKSDLLLSAAQGNRNARLFEFRRDLLVVIDSTPLKDLFDQLMSRHEHIAALVDEYGGLRGIVTMEDIVETILGQEIMDEVDTIKDMQVLARKQWEKRAKRIGLSTEEKSEEFRTL
ncbi:hemolysin family protein [Pleionea litopenaei]|uniref:Hemolysin family protein n=1 Tax=Pleionea litopenaei TaxID=3070815 RepID=A0AA51RU44_9GAMM|nr:hemolysin family protein [Pleionea sp. HL-JVS1]WMS87632.1 hemolysin family protein [Pleionea sp. HL-JVS1]